MRRIAPFSLLIFACSASAGEWSKLDTAGIDALLNDAHVIYEGATQDFYVSGRTAYHSGRPSWGYWESRDGRYCSQWPPADGWACYDVEADGAGGVRFVGDSGNVTEGRIVGRK